MYRIQSGDDRRGGANLLECTINPIIVMPLKSRFTIYVLVNSRLSAESGGTGTADDRKE